MPYLIYYIKYSILDVPRQEYFLGKQAAKFKPIGENIFLTEKAGRELKVVTRMENQSKADFCFLYGFPFHKRIDVMPLVQM